MAATSVNREQLQDKQAQGIPFGKPGAIARQTSPRDTEVKARMVSASVNGQQM